MSNYLMQSDLNRVIEWAECNNMTLNGKKFILVSYNKNPEISNEYLLQDGSAIAEKNFAKDLGIIMDNSTKFGTHIKQIEATCNKIVSMIFRSFTTREPEVMLTLFKSLVLSRIDYCSILWATTSVDEMRTIERLQSNFTLRLSGSKFPDGTRKDYWQRLRDLGLFSIQRRFERYCVIYVWKIHHALVVNPGIRFEETKRHGTMCKRDKFSTRLREESFLIKGPSLFNSLPMEIRNFPCRDITRPSSAIGAFKKQLDTYLRTIPDEPNLSSAYTKYITGVDHNGQRTNSILRTNL